MSSVLVVANPEDRDELVEPLREAGFADIHSDDGGDQTLALYERIRPVVVVISARLSQRDPRALIAAVRDTLLGPAVAIVLIGAPRGPLSTTLGASDLQVDHFLTHPLSPSALLYVVRRATIGFSAAVDASVAAMDADPTAADTDDEPEFEFPQASGADAAAPAWREPTVILNDDGAQPGGDDSAQSGGDRSQLSQADDRPSTDSPSASPRANSPRADSADNASLGDRDRPESIVHITSPTGPRPLGGARERRERSNRAIRLPGLPPSVDSDAGAGAALTWTGTDPGPTPLPEPIPLAESGPFVASQLQFADDLGAELSAELSAELGVELTPSHDGAAEASGDADAAPGPSADDGTFGHSLRRKMSAIEERLFPGRSSPAIIISVPVDDSDSESHPLPDLTAATDEAPSAGAGGERPDGRASEHERGFIERGRHDAALLIQKMYRERVTGQLELSHGDVTKEIVFEFGQPVFASSNQPEDRLATLLARAGIITPEQAQASHLRARERGQRMATELVEFGLLKHSELRPLVQRHLEEIIYSLFPWQTGSYRIRRGQFAADEPIRLSSHPTALILEGVRRKYDLPALIELVGPATSVVEIPDDPLRKTVAAIADLSPDEQALVLSFDGQRTLAELQAATGARELSVYQLAYGLLAVDAARIRRPDDAPAAEGRTDRGASSGAPESAETGPDATGLDAEIDIDRQRILAKHAMVDNSDYFSLLGVRRDATAFEVRRAYESMRRTFDPDQVEPALRAELEAKLADIREVLDEAYLVLRDDQLRGAYLKNLGD